MLAHAVVAFLALPGMVGYVVPFLLAPGEAAGAAWRWPGTALIVLGTLLLLRCVRAFYVAGRGTLAPWSPPRQLVEVGLYRWSRNPMYASVLIVLLGWTPLHRSSVLLLYTAAVATAFHLRIVLFEEPRLSEGFGKEWAQYAEEVRRWL